MAAPKKLTRKQQHQKLLRDNKHLYDVLLEIQGGHCALCPTVPSPTRKLDMDHDHTTMQIRGLLCVRCNRHLGNRGTPDWHRGAADYLENPPADRLPEPDDEDEGDLPQP